MGFISNVRGAVEKVASPIKRVGQLISKQQTPKTPKPKTPRNPSNPADPTRNKILEAGFAPKGWKPGDPDPAPEAPKTPKTIVAPKKPKEIVPRPSKPKEPKATPKKPKEAKKVAPKKPEEPKAPTRSKIAEEIFEHDDPMNPELKKKIDEALALPVDDSWVDEVIGPEPLTKKKVLDIAKKI